MELYLTKKQITSLTIIIVAFVILPSMVFLIDWFPETLAREVSNRNLLSVLARSGADHLSAHPEATRETILEAGKESLKESREWSGQVHGAGIEDTWGSWLRLSQLEDGSWEWLSLGRDSYPMTDDDRASRFKAGEVLLDPVLSEEETEGE